MNSKAISFIKNMSYSISSNLISFFISTIVILIIPKLIGVEAYGYWQLYLFYSSYVGFLHFGWNDGIYLKYGGAEYKKLDKKLFFSQFIQLLAFQLIIGVFIWTVAIVFVMDPNRLFIIKMIAIVTVLMNTRALFFFILQATNRIKEYANITILDRIIYIIIILVLLLIGIRDYKLMILADLVGKFISLILCLYSCKEIAFNKISSFYFTLGEVYTNISIGISLMIANIASSLIIGIVKLGIERTWDVTTFGKISLTLSISSMMMVFINAVGVIIFPVLRRADPKKIASIYEMVRALLMVVLFSILIFYYPLKHIMSAWLPHYSESLLYMALVFPMFIFEGKMALLINTYLKTLRKEKEMLKINMMCTGLSLILTYITTQVFMKLDFAILNIVILLIVRAALAELYLAKELNIRVKKDLIFEVLLTSIFIASGWYIDSWFVVIIYGVSYLGYLWISKESIIMSITNIKLLLKEE